MFNNLTRFHMASTRSPLIVMRDTRAWQFQVWASFGVAVFLCATGLAYLPGQALDRAFDARHEALDGFLGASYALHLVAQVAVMAESRDLQKAVGSGDGTWFATADQRGRGQLRDGDGAALDFEFKQ